MVEVDPLGSGGALHRQDWSSCKYFSRLKRRKRKSTAKIATERKLLTWIYYMLKEKNQEVEKVAKG